MRIKNILLNLTLTFFVMAFPAMMKAQSVEVQVSDNIVLISGQQYYMHHVEPGQTLYSIAKAYHVSIAAIEERNPEVSGGLQAGMVIGIPVAEIEVSEPGSLDESPEVRPQTNDDGYYVYVVEKAEKTSALLRRLKVSQKDFHALNPSVGSRVFVGQMVLIPCAVNQAQEPVEPQSEESHEQPIIDDEDNREVDAPFIVQEQGGEDISNDLPEEIEENASLSCPPPFQVGMPVALSDCAYPVRHLNETFHVALLMPLYLDEAERLEISAERIDKARKSRALSFVQFYEGFMMAVDSLTDYYGLHLDLTVIDVTENVNGAEQAVQRLEGQDIDLIIGPFFSKSFQVVQEYALAHDIPVVNPLSERESIVENARNVIKLKPCGRSMASQVAYLVKYNYPNAKVTLMTSKTVKDSLAVDAVESALRSVVQDEVTLTNAEMLELIAEESQRRKLGKKMLTTLEVEGQVFSTSSLTDHPDDVITFDNSFQRMTFDTEDLKSFKEGLSSARDNVLIAYSDDIVFATQILNNINKSVGDYPITLIGLPDWSKFDNLLVDNLLHLNTIYFDDAFVDYGDTLVQNFVSAFREEYRCEPHAYAFEGYDVGWYFLNVLMRYGTDFMDCLPYCHIPLIHTDYHFWRHGEGDGLENWRWDMYQYDRQNIELKKIVFNGEK